MVNGFGMRCFATLLFWKREFIPALCRDETLSLMTNAVAKGDIKRQRGAQPRSND